jgi:AcrR family transcriptional regulator
MIRETRCLDDGGSSAAIRASSGTRHPTGEPQAADRRRRDRPVQPQRIRGRRHGRRRRGGGDRTIGAVSEDFQAAVNRIGRRFAALIDARRPGLGVPEVELLVWSGLAVATSVSYHALDVPGPAFNLLLAELISTVLDAPTPALGQAIARGAASGTLRTRSRRESILTEATKLFGVRGFTGVSTEDIGAAVGITGPSVYNHFPAKSDILVAAMLRGDEWLRMDMHRAFAQASGPRDGLHRLLGSYCAFVLDNPHLVQVLICETGELPEAQRRRTRAAQHAYIAEWVDLLRAVHPEWDAVHSRIRVQAVLTMMNDIALTPSLRRYAGVESALVAIGAELLAISGVTSVR